MLVAVPVHLDSALLAGGGVDPTRIGGGAEVGIVRSSPTVRLLAAVMVTSAAPALVSAAPVPRPIAAGASPSPAARW